MTFMVLVCERDSRQQGVGESDEVRTLTPQVFQGLIALSWASERQVRQVHSGKEKVNPATVCKQATTALKTFSVHRMSLQMMFCLKKFYRDINGPRHRHAQVFNEAPLPQQAGHFHK
jgi:hypothetical protein